MTRLQKFLFGLLIGVLVGTLACGIYLTQSHQSEETVSITDAPNIVSGFPADTVIGFKYEPEITSIGTIIAIVIELFTGLKNLIIFRVSFDLHKQQ